MYTVGFASQEAFLDGGHCQLVRWFGSVKHCATTGVRATRFLFVFLLLSSLGERCGLSQLVRLGGLLVMYQVCFYVRRQPLSLALCGLFFEVGGTPRATSGASALTILIS